MNILFLYGGVIDPQRGGVQRVTANLADYFDSKGHAVYYLSLFDEGEEKHPARQVMLPSDRSFDTEENHSFFSLFIKEKEIDVVVDQGAQGPQTTPLVKIAKNAGCKVFGVHHNAPLAKILNFSTSFKNRTPRLLRPLLRITDMAFCKRFILSIYKKKYGQHFTSYCQVCDKLVLLSKGFIPEILFFTNGKYEDKITYITNPVPAVESDAPDIKQKELLYVGRINSEQKRVDLLLQIWEKLHQTNPDWKLSIVGGGVELEELKLLAEKLKLQNISFEGFQHPKEYYQRASIFCMTSTYEGYPMVLPEAMQCGTIPFAFNSYAAVTDIIDDGENGVLVTPFSIDEYANKLQQLMYDEPRCIAMSKKAIEKAEEFSVDRIGEKWLKMMTR